MVNTLNILATLASLAACISATPQPAQANEERAVYWAPTRFHKNNWSPVQTYTSSFNAAIVDVDDSDEGISPTRTVTQQPLSSPDEESDDNTIPFQWSMGPVWTAGSIDSSTYELKISASVVGITLGDSITANLKDGYKIVLSLFVASGELIYYLKDGNELWIHVDVKVKFDGTFQRDYRLISF